MERELELGAFKEITGNDEEIEKVLFQSFFECANQCFKDLAGSLGKDDELWKSAAHALRGICLNIGANKLADMAKEAEHNPNVANDDKQALYNTMTESYKNIHLYYNENY